MQGLSCRTAYDGNTAIAEVFKKTPDLILLDVILPDINGLELLKTFRKEHSSESLPVIMVSAFNDVDSISKCIQLGAQDYLPKPINGTILLAKVVAALERKFWREREKELVNKLHIQATTDQLTGIYNRRVIFEALDEAMENSKQSKDRQFATIMFDIDFFKQVNDNYGHAGGDAVLISFAQLLQAEISSPNIVGRIGGEEFLAILYLDPDQAKEFCTKLIKKINNNIVNFDGTDIKVSSSGGVAFSTETETSADLTNKADERLYEAKKDGRNRFKLIDSEYTMAKLLYVEDNEMNRDMLSRRLSRRGYEIIMAFDGQAGLDMMRSESPDLVLMDMGLPVLDGWEATIQAKADESINSIPIIALTAHALESDKQKALECGADDFDTKPVDFKRLLGKIEAFVGS